ncbi:universal stress protein [Actinoplanes sp. KI2]|uniref:universal stress protein n=1 Tax=Actinoplanes sp. KI2 TaxID=2983315 RepID=UPI0021D5C2C2|nr:universal stress protein [Actinoplanes sp. KI2]MCU7729499.1 universal stress protein [Actinoplanes sp. KI2]
MRHPIAAGVGGAGGWRALTWAAEFAAHTGERLILLHVCVPGSPLDRTVNDPTPAEVEVVDPALARAYTTVRDRLGHERTVLKIRAGSPSEQLADASAGARLLVIGDGEGGRTVRRVVRQAHCPIVVVRPPARVPASPYAGHVVAGVDDSPASRAALEMAYAYAEQNRLPVAALHVSGQAPGDAAGLLADAVAPWTRAYPLVPTRCSVLAGPVGDQLVHAAAGARLLVVGDKRRGVIGRARTGDVPLTVATEAPCPVAVVPLAQRDAW